MSIEYFVEGDIREHFNGDIKVYTKGNIVYSSQKSVQMSSETGITYGTPDKINENDSPANEIDVVLNLFFDGTQNNKNNTQLGEKSSLSNGDDDSYTNDYSNVAKGYDAVDPNADRQVKVYIEGIGTVDSKRDNLSWAGGIPNNIGSPMGEGDRGIEAKVTRGCIKAAQELFNKFETTEISVLKINVFGFSRGAAAARHFVHICHKPALVMIVDRYNMRVLPPKDYEHPENETKTETAFLLDKHEKDFTDRYGYFGACLLKSGVKVKKIRFNFAGLYDTVASYGLNHRGNWFVKNDSEQLHLDAVKNCRVVVQFATQEEFRENFSLTNVKKSGIRGIDLILPGVHSDIGGGYKNNVRENVLIYKGTKENCEKYKKILVEEGWYKDDKKEIEIKKITVNEDEYPIRTYYLIGKRVLSNHYSRIPLLRMIEYSEQFDVVYQTSMIERFQITDPFIEVINTSLSRYLHICHSLRNSYIYHINKGEAVKEEDYLTGLWAVPYTSFIDTEHLKVLRNKYLHWSANGYKTGMGARVDKPLPYTERTRTNLDG